jgi:dUTP pyrophosphatase
MEKLKIKVKKLHQDAILPSYAHAGDAGMDVYAVENNILNPGERKLIPTGLSFEVPVGYEMQVRPKSGLALKNGITLVNTPGTLDSGYRGELKVILINHSNEKYEVKKGEKIAQIVIAKYEEAEMQEVQELSETQRGAGGFGSTGLNKNKIQPNNSPS